MNEIVTDVYPFIDAHAIVWVKSVYDYDDVVEKCGLIDHTGEFVIPPIYDNMKYIGGNHVAVNIGFKDFEEFQITGEWGVIDLDNHILIPRKYTDMEPMKNGLYVVEYQKKYGIINLSEEIIIPFEYDYLFPWPDKNGWIHAELKGKWGCITLEGKVVIPFIYDEIGSTNEEVIPVRYGQQAYYINKDGHRILL